MIENLFDEINADIPAKVGPSFAKTIILPNEKDSKFSSNIEKPKIEFEIKSLDESSKKPSDFLKLIDKEKEAKTTKEEPVEKTIRDDNVYLQVFYNSYFNRIL